MGRATEQRALRASLAARGAVVMGPAGSGATSLVERIVPAPAARIVATPAASNLASWGVTTMIGVPWGPHEGLAPISNALEGHHSGPGTPVVVVDDIDHLDPESLAALIGLLSGDAVRLVATRRATDVPDHSVSALWRSLGLERIDLAPLTEDEVRELLRSTLGGPIDGRSATELTSLAGGNPLLVRELVDGARREGALAEVGGLWRLVVEPPLTPELLDRARSELDGSDPCSAEALDLLALAGPIPLPLAIAAIGADVTERLEREGTISMRPDGAVEVTSPILAEVLRRGLPRLARRRLAARLATAAAATEEPDTTGDLELRRVTWLVDAGEPVDAARLLAAARASVDAGDPAVAERLAARSSATRPSTEAALLESWCADERGDSARAAAVLHAHEPETDEAAIALAIRRAELSFWGRRDPETAARLLAEAAAATAAPWPLAAAAQQCVFDGLDGRCADVLERALPLVDHPEHLVGSTAALAATFSLVAVDRPHEAETVATDALAHLDGPTPALFIDPGVHVIGLGFAQHGAGDLLAADDLATAVYRHALARPGRQAQGWASMLRAHVLAARGRPAAAVEAAVEAELVWAGADLDGPARWSATIAALAHAELGDEAELAAALARVDRYDAAPFRLFEPETERARAWLLHLRGEPATPGFLASADLARSTGRSAMAAAAAHDLIRVGDHATAVDVLSDLPEGSRVTGLRRTLAGAALRGDGAALLAVAKAFVELGAEGWAAEVQALAATHLPAQAASLRRDAARFVARTGLATPPLQRLVHRPSDRALTAREAQVVELAAEGRSNRAIADELVVSLRTVENHLHRAFAKLGVSSRAELSG